MSGAISATTIIGAATAAAGVAASAYAANQQKQGQKGVMRAQANAQKAAADAAANAPKQQAGKAADLSEAAAGMGDLGSTGASTLLTGNQGVDPSLLQLGRNTLLGSNSLLGG